MRTSSQRVLSCPNTHAHARAHTARAHTHTPHAQHLSKKLEKHLDRALVLVTETTELVLVVEDEEAQRGWLAACSCIIGRARDAVALATGLNAQRYGRTRAVCGSAVLCEAVQYSTKQAPYGPRLGARERDV